MSTRSRRRPATRRRFSRRRSSASRCGGSCCAAMRRGASTPSAASSRPYGGGQDYSGYIRFVTNKTGFSARKKVQLDDDDTLLAFGRAMFHYEAGRPTPLKNEQVLYGLRLGRNKGSEDRAGAPPAAPSNEDRTPPEPPTPPVAPVPRQADAFTLDTRAGVQAIQNGADSLRLSRPAGRRRLRAGQQVGPGRIRRARRPRRRHSAEPEAERRAARSGAAAARPGDDFAGKLVTAMQRNNYWIARHPDCMNIVYVEGIDPDGNAQRQPQQRLQRSARRVPGSRRWRPGRSRHVGGDHRAEPTSSRCGR